MSDYKTKQIEKVNKVLNDKVTVNKIAILLNGNTIDTNIRILRWVESVLKVNSVTIVTLEILEKNLTQHKKNLEEEFNLVL
ncbi:hypothetical protein D3C84_1207960 [compost metagenome]